jgi:hypothetical protein
MEAILKPSYFESTKRDYNTFTNIGFGRNARNIEGNIPTAVSVDHADVKKNPGIAEVSKGAKWTASELMKLTKMGATQKQVNTLAELLPMRSLMEKSLKRGGYPIPPDISDLVKAFYTNIIKNSPIGKNFQFVEGNPILYKLNQNHASASVVGALVDLVPAATQFVNAAMAKSSDLNDPQLVQDAMDIKAFIYAKSNGLPTDNIVMKNMSFNPYVIGAIILGIVILAFVTKK